MNLYGYKVVYFDEFHNKMVTERGMIVASFFGDAMEKVIEMYGEQESEDIQIYFIEESISVITEETIRNLMGQWEDEDETLETDNESEEDTETLQ